MPPAIHRVEPDKYASDLVCGMSKGTLSPMWHSQLRVHEDRTQTARACIPPIKPLAPSSSRSGEDRRCLRAWDRRRHHRPVGTRSNAHRLAVVDPLRRRSPPRRL